MTFIKTGTVRKDPCAYGNKYWVQIEDTSGNDNSNLEKLLSGECTVIIIPKEDLSKEPTPSEKE